jgi:Flp pilus assembly protein TadG
MMKRTFNHTAASFKDNTGGNVAMLFAISVFFIIGMLALAVDITNGISAKQKLQDTTDAVALMAAKDKNLDTPAKVEAAAQALYDATYPGDTAVRIEIEDITRDGDAVTVVTKNNIDTYFSGVFNTSNLDVSVSSTAVFGKTSLDVALVLDTTGSMGARIKGKSGQTKLEGLQIAANGLIDTVENMENNDVRLSIVPFGQYVNVGTVNNRAGWLDFSEVPQNSWAGCVGSRLNGLDEVSTRRGGKVPALPTTACGSELLPLTADMTRARSSIDGLKPKGWTYIPSGVTWGWRTLEGQLPVRVKTPNKNAKHKKVMVIMTDGENTRSKSQLSHDGQNILDANSKTARLCERVKNDDIDVYTITYAVDDKTTKSLMRNCATSNAMFFDASSASELKKAFENIGRSLEVLRISA